MKKYKIIVSGCDDHTDIEEELNETEFELIKRVADKITKTSTYGCMPDMTIEEITPKEDSIN